MRKEGLLEEGQNRMGILPDSMNAVQSQESQAWRFPTTPRFRSVGLSLAAGWKQTVGPVPMILDSAA